MKTYVFSILMNLLILASLQGKIRNGYEADIHAAREGLKKLHLLLMTDTSLTKKEITQINENIERHMEFIVYYEVTARLLNQFRIICHTIYNRIDTIKDSKGVSVDVYVKFLAGHKMKGGVAGITYVSSAKDSHACSSKYGLNTVSVTIANEKNALNLLAHEFGHVHYQVQHLAAYTTFYEKTYRVGAIESKEIGHHHTDQSGQEASAFQTSFYRRLAAYLKIKTHRRENPLALAEQIRRNLELP